MTGLICGKNFWASWSRRNDYTFTGLDHQQDVGLSFLNWNVGPDGSTSEICLQSYLKNNRYISMIDRGYRINIDDKASFAIAFGIYITAIGFYRGTEELWRKTRRKAVRLIGYNDNYVGVNWHEKDWSDCIIEVPRL